MTAVRLHVDLLGVGAPRRALVLHGLGSDARTMWQVTGRLVEAGFEVHAVDLRGHGRSPAAERYAVEDMIEDVALLGGGWDLVVGHSLGGAILANLLVEDGYAARAVLLDPALTVVGAMAPMLAASIVAEVGGNLTLAMLERDRPHWHPEDRWRKVQGSATVSPRVVESCVHDTNPWHYVDRPALWTCPVHIVAADPAVGALFTVQQIPGIEELDHVTVTVVDGAGHSVHRDDFAAVAAVLDGVVGT